MAAEAEIIPETISLVKTEEESKDLTLEQCDKAVESLPGDSKKLQGGIIQPTETDECLEKAENMEVASKNGVETINTASEGNTEISKGESFLVSPEISKVASETCRVSEHSEVCEGPKSITKEECAIIDNSPKSTEEENNAAIMSIKEKLEDESNVENKFEVSTSATNKEDSLEKEVEERELEKEVCKESETAASGTGKGNPNIEEHPMADISNSSISDETVKESIKEDESSPMKSKEEASEPNIEETAKPNNDPILFNILKESKEAIAPIEVKEDNACSSSFELQKSKDDSEEEASVKASINTGHQDSASPVAETEETNIKEAEAEEVKKEIINVLAVEEKGLATTEQEGIGVDSADIDVKPVDSSITCEKKKEIPHEEDRLQAPYEHTETLVSQATDEILMQKLDNPILDVPKAESEETGEESGHEVKERLAEEPNVQTEQESGKCSSVSDVTNASNGEQSSDLGLETKKIEEKKPLDSTDLGETTGTWKDGEKAIQEEENLAKNLVKPESLKEDTEIVKEETAMPTGAQVQIPEVVSVNDEAKNVEVALADIEEKLKSESDSMAEVQSNEALTESSKRKADETSTDVHNQESEKQIKEQEDVLQDDDYINREQNANEVTKAVILSEEVDREVEKADDSEDNKEHAVDEESSTNEIHQLSKGNETINVEIVDENEAKVINRDPDAVCISKDQIDEAEKSLTSNADELTESPVDGDRVFEDKGTEQDAETKQSLTAEELETSSDYLTRRVETIVEDDISSHTSLQEEKPEKQLQTSISTLPPEDEEIRTGPPMEKIEEETQKDAEIKHESQEDSSDTKAKEEVCLQEEEQRVPKVVSEEETIVDRDLQKEKTEEQIQTASSTLPSSEEREHRTEAITIKPDEITGGQTLSANNPEEGTASCALLSKQLEGENLSRVEKTEEEKIREEEIPDKISEDSSDVKKTAEICLEREEIQELEEAKKDETAAAAQALQVGEPNEQSLTSPSALPSENLERGTTANVNEVKEEKEKELEMLEKQRPQEPDAVVDKEITVPQASITEKSLEIETISSVEKPHEEKRKEAENLENKKCEDSSARETEEKNELHALPKEEITSGQTSVVTGEELEHESNKTEDEKTNKEEIIEDNQEDEALARDENASSQTFQTEKSEEQIPEPAVTLPSDDHRHETFNEVDKTEEDKVKEEEIQKEDSNGEKIVEGIGSEKDDTRGPQTELEGETIASQVIEEEPRGHGTLREEKEIKEAETQEEEISPQSECPRELQGAIENEATAAQTLPRDEGNKTIQNEVSKEEVMEDKEVTETSYSTPHLEELTKGGSGEDELKDKLIEDKTNEALETKCQTEELAVMEAQRTSDNEIIEKQIIFQDRTVENPGQASVARIETATVTEEESSTELSQAEGSKDLAEGNEKINDTQQPEETTNIASDRQIPREFDHIENTEISSPIAKDRAAESLLVTEAESSTKETFQPQEQSPAPSSKLPSEEENGVKTKADVVEEKELKEVETQEKDSSDTKTEEICLEKEENKELKAVQTPPTEIKEDSVSNFNNGWKEDELKDEHAGVLSVETLKDGANNNIEKEIVAEDKTIKDLEQASVGMKEATIVKEEAPAQADPIESSTTSSTRRVHFPTEQQDTALEASEKPEVGDLEPRKAQQICSEAGIVHGEERRTDNSSVETTQEPASADLVKLSTSDLPQRSTGEKMQVAERVIEERQIESKEEEHVEEAETIQVKEAKTEDEKDGEERDQHDKTDSGSDVPVMVEAPKDTDTKPHKKSHNILSGVGSKVKHSIFKVKKAITGKSSHSKESKPVSPKESEK